jgi:DNA replication protein DnaC
MDSPDLFAAARESAREMSSTPPAAPDAALLERAARFLERGGWLRSVAGERDFREAARAYAACSLTERKGIYVWGGFGCGKTAFVAAATRLTRLPTVTIPLATESERLDKEEWPHFNSELLGMNVVLDDLGAEPPVCSYGVRRELAGEFITRYHMLGRGRLFITTNLDGDAMLNQYTMRITSRLKDLCVPLHLTGRDKRTWTKPGEGGAA